jgi:hypothetical protein
MTRVSGTDLVDRTRAADPPAARRLGREERGPAALELERRFSAYLGVRHVTAVPGGTAALRVASVAAGVGRGQLVITSPLSSTASAGWLVQQGAIAVLVDVEARGTLDPVLLAAAVRDLDHGGSRARRWLPPAMTARHPDGLRAAGIIVVHALGQPADIESILAIARPAGLAVIEDVSEALGAERGGRPCGTSGHPAAFALAPERRHRPGSDWWPPRTTRWPRGSTTRARPAREAIRVGGETVPGRTNMPAPAAWPRWRGSTSSCAAGSGSPPGIAPASDGWMASSHPRPPPLPRGRRGSPTPCG